MATKGFHELTGKLAQLQNATAALDGEIGSVNFDPDDPQSIEIAIRQMEAAVDERISDFSNNDMVQELASQIKEQYRQAILERASSERASGEMKT